MLLLSFILYLQRTFRRIRTFTRKRRLAPAHLCTERLGTRADFRCIISKKAMMKSENDWKSQPTILQRFLLVTVLSRNDSSLMEGNSTIIKIQIANIFYLTSSLGQETVKPSSQAATCPTVHQTQWTGLLRKFKIKFQNFLGHFPGLFKAISTELKI